MGFFSNSSTSEFKHKFTEAYNLVSSYSYGNLSISDSLAEAKISNQFHELIEIGKRINDPFNERFTFYLSSVFGEKLSIAEALIMIDHSIKHATLAKERISQGFTERLIAFAKNEARNFSGQTKVRDLLSK